jgi:hypothetical protein
MYSEKSSHKLIKFQFIAQESGVPILHSIKFQQMIINTVITCKKFQRDMQVFLFYSLIYSTIQDHIKFEIQCPPQ